MTIEQHRRPLNWATLICAGVVLFFLWSLISRRSDPKPTAAAGISAPEKSSVELAPPYEYRSYRTSEPLPGVEFPSAEKQSAPAPAPPELSPVAQRPPTQSDQPLTIASGTTVRMDSVPASDTYRVAQVPSVPADAGDGSNGAPSPATTPVQTTTNASFQLQQLEPRALHDRLQRALGTPIPLIQEPGDPWVRFSMDENDQTQVVVAMNDETKEVRLVGRPEQVKNWQQVIRALDAPETPTATTALIATRAEATPHVRQTVDILLAQATAQRDAAGAEGAAANGDQETVPDTLLGPVEITTVPGTNLFLIRGNPRDVQRVLEIIRQIEERSQLAPPPEIAIVTLDHIDPTVMTALITEVFGPASPLIAFYSPPLALPLVRPNAILIIGSPGATERTTELVKALDRPGEGLQRVRVFRLRQASSDEAQDVLEDLYDDDDDAPDLTTLTPRAIVLSDPSTNSLVVRASPQVMQEIELLINELDQTSAASAQLKVFPLKYSDAVGMLETLEALFGEADADEGGVFQLRFSVDERTNAIIAAGSSEELLVVETIILSLDTEDARERTNRVYKLHNADAEAVALALQDYVQQKREVQEVAAEVISREEQLEREIVVVPELGSNSLIISASPSVYQELERIIRDLDEQAPMVMIQVLIGEVILGEGDEFGVELGLQDSVLFDRSLLDTDSIFTTTQTISTQNEGSVNTVENQIIQTARPIPGFDFGNASSPLPNSASDRALAAAERVGAQGLSSFAVQRVSDTFGFGGFLLSASSNSVSLLLRALQQSQRLEVLSRPQIMALDNQTGTAFVGQVVPYIIGSTIDATGARTNNTQFVNVGLGLTVTPRISPDGLVVMVVTAEKSSLGPDADGVPISIAPSGDVIRAPIIDQTLAETTVSALSGQTVVLSGLLTKRDRALHRRVPILADVPLLGDLFRYDLTLTERTELLIILTPHVIRSRRDAEIIKQVESARMSWCLADVVDMHGAVGLKSRDDAIGVAEAEVIYPEGVPSDDVLPPLPPGAVPSPAAVPSGNSPMVTPEATP